MERAQKFIVEEQKSYRTIFRPFGKIREIDPGTIIVLLSVWHLSLPTMGR